VFEATQVMKAHLFSDGVLQCRTDVQTSSFLVFILSIMLPRNNLFSGIIADTYKTC